MPQGIFSNQTVWKLLEIMSTGTSLTEAARQTGLELSVASKALTRLENELGLAFIDRHQRPIRLTPATLKLLPRIKALTSAQDAIVEEIHRMRYTAENVIRVSLSAGSFNYRKVKAFRDYEISHACRIEAVVDRGSEALLRGEVDVAAVSYPVSHNTLTVYPLGICPNLPLAAPSYLSRFGTPHEPEDLVRHTLLLARRTNIPLCNKLYRKNAVFSLSKMRRLPDLHAQPGISSTQSTIAPDPISHNSNLPESARFELKTDKSSIAGNNLQTPRPLLVVSSYYPTLLATVEGQGIAFDLALGMVADRLKKHELVPVLDGWHRQPWKKWLVVRSRDLIDKPWIREFVDWYRHFDPVSSREEWTYWYQYYGISLDCANLEFFKTSPTADA